jgi:hypothetical protein
METALGRTSILYPKRLVLRMHKLPCRELSSRATSHDWIMFQSQLLVIFIPSLLFDFVNKRDNHF